MKRFSLLLSVLILSSAGLWAQNITIRANNQPAASVFARIMRQTDKNFIYSSQLLQGVRVTIDARNEPLQRVLSRMFDGTGITYQMQGNNIILKPAPTAKTPSPAPKQVKQVIISGYVRESDTQESIIGATVRDMKSGQATATNSSGFFSLQVPSGEVTLQVSCMGYNPQITEPVKATTNITYNFSLAPLRELAEVEVNGSRNYALHRESAEAGALNLSVANILAAPVVFGEADVIKSLQMEPGVAAGTEGLAGMYVHGGGADENMYMLDNVPLYQVNHFAGLFSAFNVEALKNVDFYKSSFPAKYDGRLSSFVDVHTKDGSLSEHHGSAHLGLTSGAFNIDGPIRRGTTSYSLALRRSWYDVLTIPALAILNSTNPDGDKTKFRYAFTDLNAKLTHHFSDRSKADLLFYYGEDALEAGSSWDSSSYSDGYSGYSSAYDEDYTQKLRWGNILAKAGWSYALTPTLFGEFTASWSRFFSSLSSTSEENWYDSDGARDRFYFNRRKSSNRIDDVSIRAAFDWRLPYDNRLTFGADAVLHSFLPSRLSNELHTESSDGYAADPGKTTTGLEANLYAGDDWRASDALRINAGLHASLMNVDSKTYFNLSPRFTARYSFTPDWNVKAGYSRTVQYVHQLTETYLSLPTDRWVPVTGSLKPLTADKVFAGTYYTTPGGEWLFSMEAYYKWMHNIVDFREEYYLALPGDDWLGQLTTGSGTAKGLDFKVSRELGRLTGHVAYSLLWADRTFPERNGGRTFPARYDNRHKINILLNWKINSKWELNAAWTGMSGNRISLPLNVWQTPHLPGTEWNGGMTTPVMGELNNYRLPFYHRLDLSARRNTAHGYWTFSLYNAYCNMNVVAVRLEEKIIDTPSSNWKDHVNQKAVPVFQQLHLLPIIPSVSYTWLF